MKGESAPFGKVSALGQPAAPAVMNVHPGRDSYVAFTSYTHPIMVFYALSVWQWTCLRQYWQLYGSLLLSLATSL